MEPADNKEHKIINCPVPDVLWLINGNAVKEVKKINYIELTK